MGVSLLFDFLQYLENIDIPSFIKTVPWFVVVGGGWWLIFYDDSSRDIAHNFSMITIIIKNIAVQGVLK